MHFYWTFLDIQEGMGLEKIRAIKYYWRLDPSTAIDPCYPFLLATPSPPPPPFDQNNPFTKAMEGYGLSWRHVFPKTIPLVYFSIYTDTNLK